jgi:hypothetical protein
MRSRREQTKSGLCLLLTTTFLSTLTQPVRAHPYPKDDLHTAGFSFLQDGECHEYCGLQNELCCQEGSACITEAATPTCVTGVQVLTTTWVDVGEVVIGVVKRGQEVHTTTWTETRTFTSTWTANVPDAAPSTVGAVLECAPVLAKGESWCGPVCCAFWQECGEYGLCITRNGCHEGFCPGGVPGVTVSDTSIIITTTDQFGKPTTMYSAPYRVTGTNTGSTAPSATFINGGDPQESNNDNGGLSPGAIAGIVIGTLVGIGLLILLCFCCIVRGIWGALFGGKKKKKTERFDEYEERYSRHGSRVPSSRHSRRDTHGSWYGDRPPKKSGGKGWLGLTALGTLVALLTLRKDKKKPKPKAGTVYSDSYYSYSGTGTSQSKSFLPLANISRAPY